jgi:hypothetical protein
MTPFALKIKKAAIAVSRGRTIRDVRRIPIVHAP